MRFGRLGRPLAALAVAAALAGCGYSDPTATQGAPAGVVGVASGGATSGDSFSEGAGGKAVKFPDGLQYVDTRVGTGAYVGSKDTVSVQYTGWLASGSKFDSSRDRGAPFSVQLGAGQVIPGWDEGVPGMRAGGRRRLVIPPALGYGDQGSPPVIPGGSTLVFMIEVLEVTPAPSPSPSSSPGPSPSASP